MTRPRYFAIFAAQRTGSNLLEKTLDRYEGLVGVGEAFNPGFIGGPETQAAYGATLAERNRDPLGFLSRITAAHAGQVPGFRIFEGHDGRVIDHAARDPDCAPIILTRAPLDSYLSLKIAQKTDQWLVRKAENRRLVRVTFDVAEFDAYRARIAAHYARVRGMMRAAGRGWVEFTYDDLHDLDQINGVARYVGATEAHDRLRPRIEKQNPPDPMDKVDNPEALAAYLASGGGAAPAPTPHAGFEALDAMLVARGVETVCAPIPGCGDGALRAFLEGLRDASGADAQPLVEGIKGKQIVRRRGRGAFVFSLIRAPEDRVRDVYNRFVVGDEAPEALASLREVLARDYGAAGGEDGFDAFLAFIRDSLAGRTALWHPAWVEQAALLAAYAEETPVDFVARAERLGPDLAHILARLGLPDDGELAAGLCVALASPETPRLTAEQSAAIAEIYARDYDRLGYARPRQSG